MKEFDQIYLQELDDHRIPVKFFNDLDQNWLDYYWKTLVEIRILQEFLSEFWFGKAADCGIPMEFWLEFQLILNGAKSADCVNYKVNS